MDRMFWNRGILTVGMFWYLTSFAFASCDCSVVLPCLKHQSCTAWAIHHRCDFRKLDQRCIEIFEIIDMESRCDHYLRTKLYHQQKLVD